VAQASRGAALVEAVLAARPTDRVAHLNSICDVIANGAPRRYRVIGSFFKFDLSSVREGSDSGLVLGHEAVANRLIRQPAGLEKMRNAGRACKLQTRRPGSIPGPAIKPPSS
jgi:hypothetical protein